MAKVEFIYNGNVTSILCSENESMQEICERFATKAQTNINNLIFLYSGNNINLKNTLSKIINNIDKERKVISIIVNQLNTLTKTKSITSLVKSDLPICPECSETTMFNVANFYINLTECKNRHVKNLFINEYEKTQYIDLKKIICKGCGKNKAEVYHNKMYICYSCKSILCPLCKDNHDKKHVITYYDFKNFLCERHCEAYTSYCTFCKANLCLRCQKYHQDQYIMQLGNIFPEKDELLAKLSEIRKVIDEFKKDIKQIIYQLNNVKENIEILYKIYYEMITKFDDRKRNYEAFMSLNSINNNIVFQNIQQVNQTKDMNNKFQLIMGIYAQINQDYNNLKNQQQTMEQQVQQEKQQLQMMQQQMQQPMNQQQQMGYITTTQGQMMGQGVQTANQNNMNNNNLNGKKYIGCKNLQTGMGSQNMMGLY